MPIPIQGSSDFGNHVRALLDALPHEEHLQGAQCTPALHHLQIYRRPGQHRSRRQFGGQPFHLLFPLHTVPPKVGHDFGEENEAEALKRYKKALFSVCSFVCF